MRCEVENGELRRGRALMFSGAPNLGGAAEGNGNGVGPSEPGFNSLELLALLLGKPEEKLRAGLEAVMGDQWKDLFQVSHRAHGDKIERGRGVGGDPVLQAVGAGSNGFEAGDPGGLFEESALFRHGLEQGDGKGWESDLEGQAWETGAAADVEETALEGQEFNDEQAFAKVAGDALLRVANGGEVDFLIPADEEIEVSIELFGLRGGGVESEGVKELSEAARSAHGADCKGFSAVMQGMWGLGGGFGG